MSRHSCETCLWCVMGVGEYGICTHNANVTPYAARNSAMLPVNAAERIVYEDTSCEHWTCEHWERRKELGDE